MRENEPPGESERHYRAIFEHPFEYIAVLEAVRAGSGGITDWRYCDANANWLRLAGRAREALIGRTLTEALPERAAELIPLYAHVLNDSRARQHEERVGRADLLISLFPIGTDTIVVSGVDISARIGAEAEVRRLLESHRAEREWLSAVLNAMTEEVYFADTRRRYTYANPAAIRRFGHATIEGADIEQVVSGIEVFRPDGTRRPFSEAPPVRALAGETVRAEEQVVRIPGTGELRYRQVSAAPVRDGGGRIIGSVSVVRDVTDMRLRQKEAAETMRQRRELIAALAHELRNPLAPIRAGLALLAKAGERPELIDRTRQMMQRQVAELVATIDRLLESLGRPD